MENKLRCLSYLRNNPDSLSIWRKMYEEFIDKHRIVEAAECVLTTLDFNKNDNEDKKLMMDKLEILFFAAVLCLQNKDTKKALQFIEWMSDELTIVLYYKGLAYYYDADYDKAQEYFQKYISRAEWEIVINEEIYFYLGYCYYQKNDIQKAIELYQLALERRKSFAEALINIALIFKENGDIDTYHILMKNIKINHAETIDSLLKEPRLSPLTITAESREEEIKSIPIFINSRDRYECLKNLVEWLLVNGYTNILILDNASTYGPLLKYYEGLMEKRGVQVIYLRENIGHTALWLSGILEKLNITTPYVYTDSDILPVDECPGDCIKHFLRILEDNPLIKKAGFGIKIDDITYFDKENKIKHELKFWNYPMDIEQYFANIDTTFAVYRNTRFYTYRESIRTGYPYIIKHIPFYYDYSNLPDDEKYYLAHANSSASTGYEWNKNAK